MGWNFYKIFCCCNTSEESTRLDIAVVREQQAAAAEKRLKEQESRGVKNPERIKRIQRKQQKRNEEVARQLTNSGTGLKWQVS